MGLVGHVQGVVVFKHDMVALPVEAQGIIGTRTKFNHAVNREILRVVFKIVPQAWVNVSHVGAGDVNKVFVTAFRRLVLTPSTVQERGSVMPAVLTFLCVV